MTENTAIKKSYSLLALLSVCEQAARHLDELDPSQIPAAAGSLANCIELAAQIAGEVHDAVETAGKDKSAG